ncbi:MAG: bifunctional diaminohydroxyphosphoribosylaminopyrimidine deaminase/5-amino-6-(5-phosphoribosylamino)uracil reductase RibD [Candidatus Omnitrophica bacterium]|nr:bifunctional diaminohydroxyphosphoribosylaminopyrimidine deaminase/5-amino-6-(5-phosphoribosylamino)uracil reductase RibD [Candidatus Omnitrophota bacterium]
MIPRNLDERYMRQALRLARRGIGRTSPNPMVGAVLVKHGRVIGTGYHQRAGRPHAEANALRAAGSRARGATLYVTLEPCQHTGRTPPCCEAILAAGIRRVVVASKDPNPITRGRGLAYLRRAGIALTIGLLAEDARRLNAPFEKAMTEGLPLVIAKIGQSLDGKIATTAGESQWITSAASRRLGHRLRGEVDAVLLGITTVLRDNPRLTARGVRRRAGRPVRVIVDSCLRIPLNARCVQQLTIQPTIVATTVRSNAKRLALRQRGVDVIAFPGSSRVPLRRLFQQLAQRGVQSLLIEGGGEVLASALAERVVDRVLICVAPLIIGGREAIGAVGGRGIRRLSEAIHLDQMAVRRVGPDLCVEGRLVYPR